MCRTPEDPDAVVNDPVVAPLFRSTVTGLVLASVSLLKVIVLGVAVPPVEV